MLKLAHDRKASGRLLASTVRLMVRFEFDAVFLERAYKLAGLPEKFISEGHWPRPAFDRTATIRGELIRRIQHEIATAPEVRKGRRKTADKWKS